MACHLPGVALALIGSGVVLGLKVKVGERCLSPNDKEVNDLVDTFCACVWWVALVAATVLTFQPHWESVGIASLTASAATAFVAGVFLIAELFVCELINAENFRLLVWGCVRVTVAATLVAFAWRAWKSKQQRQQRERSDSDSDDEDHTLSEEWPTFPLSGSPSSRPGECSRCKHAPP